MAADDPQLKFRVPADLRRRLEASAKKNHRSISAEVVARLEGTFDEIAAWPYLPERYGDDREEDQVVAAFATLDPKVKAAIIEVMRVLQPPSNNPE